MKYKVPFVDVPTHYASMKEEILETVDKVFSNGDLILRSDVEEFETNIADYVGTKYAVSLNSGFDALHHSVRAMGIGPGDEVITVAHTFVATVAAIVHCGGKPVLIDVGQDFNMDVSKIESAITPQTKAIIPVHLNGRLCDMDIIQGICSKYDLMLIEDACQSLGATFKGKRSGSFGLTGCFSMYPFKMLGAFGDAGIVTTDSEEIAKKITWLRDHGQDRESGEVKTYGFNTRMDNIQAAFLNVKLKRFPDWINRRLEVADMYRQGLNEVEEIDLPHFNDPNRFDVYQNYVVSSTKRDALAKHLRDHGVEVLISWESPMHSNRQLGLSHFSLPKTEALCNEVLSLPMNPDLTDEQVIYVVDTVKTFFGQ